MLELAAGEVDRRFDHEDLHTIKEIELLLLNAGNGELSRQRDKGSQHWKCASEN